MTIGQKKTADLGPSGHEVWDIRCPTCQVAKVTCRNDQAVCSNCQSTYAHHDGVTYLTDLTQAPALNDFVKNYKIIRANQGYTGHNSAFYRDLPKYPKSGPEAGIWYIRQRSFAKLMQHLNRHHVSGAKILDLGSGNGWLSHQLAQQKYSPCAVDINDDWDDGLRGLRHYPLSWPALVSSFDRLPFFEASLDAVIFNGSFHYSQIQSETLEEAKRVLKPGGQIIIMDSPIYGDPSSGKQMMADRARYHLDTFQYQSEIDITGFLTWKQLEKLAKHHDLELDAIAPWYGLKWALRPVLSWILRSRQPARFALVVLKKLKNDGDPRP